MAFPQNSGWAAQGLQVPPGGPHFQVDALNNEWLVTANRFTVTSTNVTPTFGNIGGWPCLNLTNSGSTATDVANFCVPAAGIIPQAGKRIWIRHTIRMTTTSQDWAFGCGVVGTNMINTDPTDHFMIKKLAANTFPSLYWRSASGTVQKLDLALTFVADTWYTFALEAIADPGSVAGRGKINVYGGAGFAPESGTLPLLSGATIGTQFPDATNAVKIAPFHAWRAGSAANVSGYSTHFSVAMDAPANL